MKKERTICDAIKIVLIDKPEGMTAEQIYNKIIEENLYEFNAQNPQSVVTSTIRSSCVGVENKFTTKVREFVIVREDGNDTYYALNNNSNSVWFPALEEYDPGFSLQDWLELFKDKKVFTDDSMKILTRILEMGGEATCKELSEKYGEDSNYYNKGSSALAQRIHKKTNCPLMTRDDGGSRWWSVLYLGKDQDTGKKGEFVWKLREELKEALETYNSTVTTLTGTKVSRNSWLLCWNPKNYDWDNEEGEYSYDTMIKNVKEGGAFVDGWRCQSTKVKAGDRFFLIRLGVDPKGIVAAGYTISDSFYNDNGVRCVDTVVTNVLDYKTEKIIPIETLKEKFPNQHWSPQGSGISLDPDAAQWLIDNWENYSEQSKATATTSGKDDNPDGTSDEIRYWLYAPGANAFLWDEFYDEGIMAIGWEEIDDIRNYSSREDIKYRLQEYYNTSKSYHVDTLALWNFAYVMKPGDVVFCKKGLHQIVGCGIVTSEYDYDTSRKNYKHIHKVKWISKGVWDHPEQAAMKTLTDITSDNEYVQRLKELVGVIPHEQPDPITPYTKQNFLDDVYMSEIQYNELRALLENKKNIILQGAPGVGKTFTAKKLAYSIMGEMDDSRIEFIQFHQNYSYEDFIMGYRPAGDDGFKLKDGVFYRFCQKAANNSDRDYFFIIDEINRGNMSKIFGELLMLVENDKRGEKHKISLVYNKEIDENDIFNGGRDFYIPQNIYIIGMMNTADRSLAMIDYALRRRFCFYTMRPAFEKADENGFGEYMKQVNNCVMYNNAITAINALNTKIREELGKGFEIGHSYFSTDTPSVINDEWVKRVIKYEIIPLIEEYWFDNDDTLREEKNKLMNVIGGNDDD